MFCFVCVTILILIVYWIPQYTMHAISGSTSSLSRVDRINYKGSMAGGFFLLLKSIPEGTILLLLYRYVFFYSFPFANKTASESMNVNAILL